MNHDEIAAQDVIARYVTDRLPPDDEREFEAHLVECAQCVDAVEEHLELRAGLRAAAAESMAGDRTGSRPAAMTRIGWLAAAAALLLAASVALAAMLIGTRAELRDARAGRQEQQQLAEQARTAAAVAERRARELEGRPQTSTAPAPPVSSAIVFALTAVRGGGDAPSVNRMTVPADARLIVLTVDVPPVGSATEYTVALQDQTGREIWSGGGFTPSTSDVLSVALEHVLLPDGRYTVAVSHDAAGRAESIGRYPLEIASR
jgi:hypothetical protein